MEEEWRLTIADDRSLSEHYGRGDLAAKILEALRAARKDPDALTIEDLGPIDQLHARGRGAPLELGRLAGITAGMRVLEVGSTARTAPQRALALHEILAGPVSPIHLPVPWARDPGLSQPCPPEEMHAPLKDTGFEELAWIDETAPAVRWHQERLAATPGGPLPLVPYLMFGDDFGKRLRNQLRNLS